MISPETRTEIRRHFYAEHWKIGTIARELNVHPDAVRNAIESERFKSRQPLRASIVDPYIEFTRPAFFGLAIIGGGSRAWTVYNHGTCVAMKIFLSHSSRQKPLVREIKTGLPEHVRCWIDEQNLLIGDPLETSLKMTIRESADFVILFVDSYAARSAWVQRELTWALELERELDRPFVLPIVLEADAWEEIHPAEFKERKYIRCDDFSEVAVRLVATELTAQLFAWLSRDLERLRAPKQQLANSTLSIVDEADQYLEKLATTIRRVLHPYRRENPMALAALVESLRSQADLRVANEGQLNDLLVRLRQQGRLAGVACHRDSIFIEEEHLSWKASLFSSEKERLARKAIELIDTGQLVLLDAGSTISEIARQIGRGLKLRFWGQLTVVTNSISVANELLLSADEMGMEDDNTLLRLYIAGGRVRLNTHAIVDNGDDHSLQGLVKSLSSQADIAFVGTNGIFSGLGFTTQALTEKQTKSTMLSLAARKIVVTDPSKFGIRQQNVFATFEDGVEILTTGGSAVVEQYRALLRDTRTRIIIA